MSDGTRSTVSAEPARRESAAARTTEPASAPGVVSNLAIQRQVHGGGSVAGLPGAPLDNLTAQSRTRKVRRSRDEIIEAVPSLDRAMAALVGASQPLPHRDQIKASFGRHDVSDVRTITGGPARGANEAFGARAFTAGDRIGFREAPSMWLAAHESAHVVQQRDGTSSPGESAGNPWERHADRVADAVVARRSAELLLDEVTRGDGHRAPALQLDKETTHPGNAPESFVATSGDRPGTKYLSSTAQGWMMVWGDLLLLRLASYLAATDLVLPSQCGHWSAGAADFMRAMWAPFLALKASTGKPYVQLGAILAPDGLDPLINAGRDAPRTDKVENPYTGELSDARGDYFWAEAVVAEIGKILIKRVIESLAREVPRWIAARNQLALSSQGPAKTVDRDPEPSEIVASHPIDRYVVAGLKNHVTVDFKQYRAANPDQNKLGDMRLGQLERVSYRWLHDQGAWNWIEVLAPGATVENVAYTLYGDSSFAYTITGAPPLFGITNTEELAEPAKSEYASHSAHAAKPPVQGDDPDIAAPEQQIQKPSVMADNVLLAEASADKKVKPSGIKPDEDGRKVLVDRMNASLQTFQLISKTSAKMPHGGYGNLLSDAYDRLRNRALKVADRTNSMNWIVAWDRQTIAQNDLLRQALNGITVAVAQYKSFSAWPSSKLVTQQVGWMYLKVASLSEQAVAGEEALAAANEASKLFPVTVMELVLAEVRKVLHTEEGAKWDNDKNHDSRTDFEEHKKREAKLRLSLARVRDELLQNQEKAASDLQQLQADLAALQNEVALVADMDSIEAAWQALYDDMSTVGVLTGTNTDDTNLMSGAKGHDAKSNPALLDLWSEWNAIYREYKYGDPKLATERLNERRPKLTELLAKVQPLIKDNETLNKWVTFGILLGISLVTAGVGAYVEGAAAVAWGAESWATFAATTGAEAFTFTTLSYGFVEKDPTIGGYFLELGKSIVMFGALKGISNKYISFVGKEAAGTVDTMIVQYVAMNTASLAEADLHKYLATGKHLTLDEALDISKQNALFTIASGIASAAAKPGLETLKLQGSADSALARLRSTKAELKTLAVHLETAKTANPSQVEALLVKQREVLVAQDEALRNLEKLAANPKTAKKAGIDDAMLERLADARQAHAATVHELELAAALQYTEGAGAIRYAEHGAKWDSVVSFWRGVDGATVEPVVVDKAFGSHAVDITTKDGETFRLLERTAENAKAVNQTSITVPGSEGVTPPSADTAAAAPAGGTKSAPAYTLSDTPVQSAKSVAAVARDLAPSLAVEGIELGGVKAEAPKGAGGTMRAGGTLKVTAPSGGEMTVPVSIEVVSDVAGTGGSAHGADAGHASVQVKPDGKGGWSVAIRIDERLASEASVESHLRHELREASEILGNLARDPAFDVEAAQRASSLEDPAATTAHDRAAAKELRDLASELGDTISAGEAARKRIAESKVGGSKNDREMVERGTDARARLDSLLDSMGLTEPTKRAEKIKTVLELAGGDPESPLGEFLEGYAQRTDAGAVRGKLLDSLDATTRTKVMDAIGPYADLVPPESLPSIIDAVNNGNAAKVGELVQGRAAGILDDATLVDALDTTARQAKEAAAETREAGGKRLYKMADANGNEIRADGLSKEQDDAFRAEIDAAEKRERAVELAKLSGEQPDPADAGGESALDARYRRYRARCDNAVSLKPGEPMPRAAWEDANPQLRGAAKEGRTIEAKAIKAAGATVSNNAAGQYDEFTYYDKKTNKVVTTRPDARLGDATVESKYIDPDSTDQVVYDTAQTRAQRAQGGKAGHVMVLSTKVEPGKPPAKLRPSVPLADSGSEIYFFDPALDAITYKWNNETSTWAPSKGPNPP